MPLRGSGRAESDNRNSTVSSERPESTNELVRGFGLLEAAALNMSNMVGLGPFITIPAMLSTMGGPQAMLGWLLGTLLALCDGLV